MPTKPCLPPGRSRVRLAALALAATTGLAGPVVAQPPTPAASPEQTLYLVRATLLSLDDANRTGNYSVLRDLAAPSFQRAHTPADLALIFADLRRKGIPFTAAAIATPSLPEAPSIDANHVLRIAGHLPTAPLRLSFDLRFEAVAGAWRLAGLGVSADPPQQSVGMPPQPAAAQRGAEPRRPAR